MVLYLFNPDNDLALGNNSIYYQAPASALKMAADLAVLPAWIAASYPRVMVAVPDKELAESWMNGSVFTPQVQWVTLEKGVKLGDAIYPWGWNGALVRSLKEKGVSLSLLPSDNQLDRLRYLSSRLRAVEILEKLMDIPGVCGMSRACHSLEDIETVVQTDMLPGEWNVERKMLKAPWSGSGKGLRWACGRMLDNAVRNWCRRILATQQAVVVEPFYQKIQDFAMEFEADGNGNILFVGYSLFYTDGNGAYKGNALLPDDDIVAEITRYISVEVLETVKHRLQLQLKETLQCDYCGFLGVDMMICRFGEAPYYRLHPCVEINLRMNMGIVSHTLYNRWIVPGSKGVFRIDFFKNTELLLENHQNETHDHPLVMQEGRVLSGYLSLTPIAKDTMYRAALWVTSVSK